MKFLHIFVISQGDLYLGSPDLFRNFQKKNYYHEFRSYKMLIFAHEILLTSENHG